MRRTALGALVVFLVFGPGCAKKPEVSFDLDVPGGIAGAATWYEIAAFRGASCDVLFPQLAGGLPIDGAAAKLAFKKGDKDPPPIGDLPKDSYAFGAVARKDDCSVIARGCTIADVKDARSVSVVLKSIDEPQGACAQGAVCRGARCVPANDDNDPSIGAGCSLQLLGTGPLGNPLGVNRTRVSSPAIITTPDGFLIAYREADQGIARLTILPVDSGGGAQPGKRTTLSDRCDAVDPDATGLTFDGQAATVAVAQTCNGQAGVFIRRVDTTGEKIEDAFNTGPNATGITLAPSHALSYKPNARPILAFSLAGQTRATEIDGVKIAGANGAFGGAPPQTSGFVSATDQMVALLSLGTGTGGTGLDGGVDPDAATGTGDSTLRLQLAAANASLAALPPPIAEIKGTWGSLAANGRLALVATDGSSPNKPVKWAIYELGNGTPLFNDGFTTEGPSKVSYSDVAFQGDRMFFAVERGGSVNPQTDTVTLDGSISLVAFDRATKAPLLVRTVDLSKDPRIPSMKRVRDGLIAVVANDTRVAVVWANARELLPNDTVGGYAVFACTP